MFFQIAGLAHDLIERALRGTVLVDSVIVGDKKEVPMKHELGIVLRFFSASFLGQKAYGFIGKIPVPVEYYKIGLSSKLSDMLP